MFSALAENKGNLNKKINLFIAMSPVVILTNSSNDFLREIKNDIDDLQWWFDFLGIWYFFGDDWLTMSKGLCAIKDDWCNKAN